MRYILVEYEYGFERTHEYLYSQVYTRSIPWACVQLNSGYPCVSLRVQFAVDVARFEEIEAGHS
jgi:hypothetical protein